MGRGNATSRVGEEGVEMFERKNVFALLVFCLLCSCGTTKGVKEAGQGTARLATAKDVKTVPMGKVDREEVKTSELSNPEGEELPGVAFVRSLKEQLSNGNINEAIASFEDMPDALREDVDLQILHASLLLSSGRNKEAGALGDKLMASNGSNTDVLELQATIAAASGDTQKRDALLTKILKADPLNVSANVQKGAIEAARHKYRPAYNYYKKALQGDSTNTDALFGCGQMAYYNGSLGESEKCFKTILQMDASNDSALAYMGKLAAEGENYLTAAKYAEKAIAINPDDYSHQVDYGRYLRSLGRYDDATAAWTRAIKLKPDYFLAYTYRASLQQERKMYKGALQDYYDVVRTNPKYYFAFEEIGMLEWQAGRMEECRKGFLKALEASKDNWAYELMIAATYIKQKDIEGMKKYLTPCMKNMDRSSEEYLMLRMYYDQGTVNAEMQLKNKIAKVEKATKRGKLLYYMGLYYDMRGNTDIGNDFYAQVIAMQAPMFFEYQMAEWGMGM